MITTLNDIIKLEGFEPSKKYAVDKWVGGVHKQYHINAICLIEDTVVLWSYEYCDLGNCTEKTAYTQVITSKINSKDKTIWADSEESMKSDHEELQEEYFESLDEYNDKCEKIVHKFARRINNYDRDSRLPVQIAQFLAECNGEIDILLQRIFAHKKSLRFFYEDNIINDEVKEELSNIYRSHSITFYNGDKRINIDLTKAIEINNVGRHCINIKMNNEDSYGITNFENTVIYKCLKLLYNL